jgi:hypothetical protein
MSYIYQRLTDKYPFISLISYGSEEYIGIIQNRDAYVTNFYDLNSVQGPGGRQQFLDLGEQWWWESNRTIPINIFLKQEWQGFKSCLRIFNSKDVVLMHGPAVSLAELVQRKTKRRSITLIRKPAQ